MGSGVAPNSVCVCVCARCVPSGGKSDFSTAVKRSELVNDQGSVMHGASEGGM